VTGVEIKNTGGTWEKLLPMSIDQIETFQAPSQFLNSPAVPRYYRLQGSSVTLYPAPNYTQASSLRVHFWQDVLSFAVTDTTGKTPGFAAPFHRALSIGIALDWAIANKPEKVVMLSQMWQDYEIRIRKFYSHRYHEMYPPVMSVRDATVEFK
jgi:hypothetical protein